MPKPAKEKFVEQREEAIKLNPIRPLNEKQAEYINLLNTKTVIAALGFAGTSKTFLPTAMGADLFRTGKIKQLVFSRPAISNSKSVGYFKGSVEEKMQVWLTPVISILRERLGQGALEVALKKEQITYQPLESIKGCSFNDAWIVLDEGEDLTQDEVKKVVTRVGRNSKLILAGDITQSELKDKSGLKWLHEFIIRHNLKEYGFVDFNDPQHIVRSDAVKRFIMALEKDKQHATADRLYSLEHKYD